jgi:acyl-lipid omega-3 desaturase
MYHNHMDKDYSYPWLTKEKFEHEDAYLARILHSNSIFTFLFPFYAWPLYTVLGQADGNHFIPFPSGRLWQNTPVVEYFKCIISAVVVGLTATAIYYLSGQNFSTMAFYYLGPWVIFGWWLICVTYLQHHDPETLVYGDSNWTFVDAAFETVDRQYGFLVDNLTHHITDGHVVHHLFFTKIPHYNLPMATKALQNYLKEKNLYHIYRFEKTLDFPYRVHKYLVSNGFRVKEKKDVTIALESKKEQ